MTKEMNIFVEQNTYIHNIHTSHPNTLSLIVKVHLPVSSRGVLMVKILNKCILSIKEYNLFLDSAICYIHRNISIHR